MVGLLGAIAAPVVAGHAPVAPFMGLATWFLGQLLLGPKPPRALEKALDTVRAANSWTSADVVFVSRVKKATDV